MRAYIFHIFTCTTCTARLLNHLFTSRDATRTLRCSQKAMRPARPLAARLSDTSSMGLAAGGLGQVPIFLMELKLKDMWRAERGKRNRQTQSAFERRYSGMRIKQKRKRQILCCLRLLSTFGWVDLMPMIYL